MKDREIFTSEEHAIQYKRKLEQQGYKAAIYEAYNWQEQRTHYTVIIIK